ncbi:MAG: right-handed parallel beta-helix repeat-containing protein [Anaerolineae bacterium]|nr:right-handed parallel beta-helix repeat-containing protein [Anaerolineae bacterium]
MTQPVTLTVGPRSADLCGSDHRALQAAVDYVAGFGGGLVRVLPGTYLMRDSLHLRSGVRVEGSGEDTILLKDASRTSPLYLDGDYGEEQITLVDATGFEPGISVTVTDDRSGGFHVTVARVTGREGNTLLIDRPLQADYLVSAGAVAHTTFPVISGYHIRGASVAHLTVDGNREANVPLTGCRGAGIFLYRAHGTVIEGCAVRRYNGDGISFQQSNDVIVRDCECAHNAELGLHPGSGSQRPVISGCRSHHNGRIGLFLCWRVRHGRFTGNVLEANGQYGISIGHKDTDNLFEDCTVVGNGRHGIYFRPESEPMAGHRNTFVRCTILGNGPEDAGGGAGVRVEGFTRGIVLRDCVIGDDGSGRQHYGVSVGPDAEPVALESVTFRGNLVAEIHHEGSQRTSRANSA